MSEIELIKGLKFLGLAYGKEFDQSECQVYYDFLQDYSYDTFRQAVKSIIKKSKFLPKINELIDECDNFKHQIRYDVVEFMRQRGYFKAPEEYEKTTMWLTKGIVPAWLQEDINKYYKMMKQEELPHQEILMIGE